MAFPMQSKGNTAPSLGSVTFFFQAFLHEVHKMSNREVISFAIVDLKSNMVHITKNAYAKCGYCNFNILLFSPINSL